MTRTADVPRILVVAGFEASGRVGLLADVAAVTAAGGTPLGVVSVLTAQGSRYACAPVSVRVLRAQLLAALHGRVAAAKLGVVPDATSLHALWPELLRLRVPLVVDPVVRTSRGERLSRLRPEDYLGLAGPRVWLTPNVPELSWLLQRKRVATSVQEVTELAVRLCAQGFAAVVVKGGHLEGAPVDVLVCKHGVRRWRGTRLVRPSTTRGTGCRFASTLATSLGQGLSAEAAVQRARAAVRRYLRS